jgi:hypothetical protein
MRLIVVEVDNDETAEKLVAKLNATGFARVKGMFQVPKARCKCANLEERFGKLVPAQKKSIRGQLFGWWVHDVCHKVAKGLHSESKNLIKREDQPQGEGLLPTYVDYIAWHDKGFYNDDPK